MTSTVLRVKRRLEEENPRDALVLLCKRMKTDEDEEISVSPSLFIFRGNVDNPGNINAKVLVPRSEPKRSVIPKVDDIIEKLRKERKEATTESRYEILNASRGLTEFIKRDDVDIEPKNMDMWNLAEYAEHILTCTLQYTDVTSLDQLVRIENYITDFLNGSICDDVHPTSEEELEDPNDDNYWRNEYPDYGASYAKYKAKVLAENPDLKFSEVYYGQDEDPQQSRDQYKHGSSDEFTPD